MKKYNLFTFWFLIGVALLVVFFLFNSSKNNIVNLDLNNYTISKQVRKLKIASFNIQVLGRSKIKKPEVVEKLVKILSRYDVIFIQELRDSSGLAIKKLLNKLNNYSDYKYKIIVSERLGLTSSKEQYVFFYKDFLKLISTYQYKGKKDDFNRDPFAAIFAYNKKKIAFLGVHIDPDDVKKELNYLDDVYYATSRKFQTKNLILFGDLNADCSYLSKYALSMLDLKRDKNFVWYINSDYDTTVSKTDCAYDRLISNKKLSYFIENVQIFDFKNEYNLTTRKALKISDHYPIEFDLILKDGFYISLLYCNYFYYIYTKSN